MVYSIWVIVMKKRKTKKNKFKLIIYILLAALLIYFATAAIKIVNLNAERNRAATENEELQQKKEALELQLENINSPDYIESQARSDLKLIKPNELLFIFPDEADSKKNAVKEDSGNAEDKNK